MNNVHGNYIGNQIHGDYISSAQIHVNFTIKSASERQNILEHIREAYSIPPSGMAQSTIQMVSQPNTGHTIVAPMADDPYYVSATRSIIEIRLMIDMVRMMIDHPTLCPSASLPDTLASLEKVLKLTELCVQAYHHTPLSESLSRAIAVEVDSCRRLLQELLSGLSDHRHMLSGAVLYLIRKYVWQNFGRGGVVDTLDLQLQKSHRSFAACLLALGQ